MNKKSIGYSRLKRFHKKFIFNDNADKFFKGLNDFKNAGVIKKPHNLFPQYLKYAVIIFIFFSSLFITLLYSNKNKLINYKYNSLIYSELLENEYLEKAGDENSIYKISYNAYDYLENSLDLLEDKN